MSESLHASAGESATLSFYRERQPLEAALTLGVVRAIPEAGLDYRPHPRSPCTRDICSTLVSCLRVCVALLREHDVDMVFSDPIEVEEITEPLEKLSAELHAALQEKDNAFWEETVIVRAHGSPVLQQPRSSIYWLFLFDAIHHRGQISTYLRPMGGRVPSIYGTSGDSAY